jgi:GNAT superfamily N-acetyltransferase
MKINEIFKIRSYDPSDDLVLYHHKYKNLAADQWRKVPGDNPFFHSIQPLYRTSSLSLIAVKNSDEAPHYNQWEAPFQWKIVGALNAYNMGIDNYYQKVIYGVGAIGVNPEFRGQGIAQHLYDGFMLPNPSGLDGILMAGDSQSPGGRAMWANLKSRSDIEVTGWVKIRKNEGLVLNYSDNQMAKFFSKVGGTYLGETEHSWFFEFPVEKLPNKRELEIAVKGSGVKVYGGGSSTGLIARYVG